MAAITYYMTNTVTDNWQILSETSPGADAYASPVVGWIVGNTAITPGTNDWAIFRAGAEAPELTFGSSTGQPDGIPVVVGGGGDCWRSPTALNGDFASANWTINGVVRANTNGGAQDGRIRYQLLYANADGSSPTVIGTAQNGALLSNVSTSADFNSSVTFNPGAFSIPNKYLFIELGWERTGPGGMSSSDINFRIGTNSTLLTTADFTAVVPDEGPAYIGGGYYG